VAGVDVFLARPVALFAPVGRVVAGACGAGNGAHFGWWGR
jgi:hypothetical protein